MTTRRANVALATRPGHRRRDEKADEVVTPAIRVQELSKTYKSKDRGAVAALTAASLVVEPGEMVVLLGPSGCGKTTLLRCIAGLETPDCGRIEIGTHAVFDAAEHVDVPTERRPLSMMYQSYALWPHMTAVENVSYPLRVQKAASRSAARTRANEVLEMVGVAHLVDSYPSQMSGGQQQRVALARSLVSGRGLVLFDEPLSNVDAAVRAQLRTEMVSMQKELGFAGVYVTHDQGEALALGHRVAVLREGRLVQVDTPRGVYHRPQTRYVANFVGIANELEGTYLRDEGEWAVVDTPIGVIHGSVRGEGQRPGDRVVVVFRPERCVATADCPPGEPVNRWTGAVTSVIFGGAYSEYVVRVGETDVRVWRMSADAQDDAKSVSIELRARSAHVLAID